MYFKNFANIDFNEQTAKNIIARPKIVDDVLSNSEAFYDYVIPEGMRAEEVANYYYDDVEYVWLVYLANGIVDPYYDWPLSQQMFNEFIISKYGSIEAAKAKIIHYTNKTTGALISKDTYDLNGTFNKIQASQYEPLTAYANEEAGNEAKRTIRLIDKRFASQMKAELKKAMNG